MRNVNDFKIFAKRKELNRIRIRKHLWEVKELAKAVDYSLTHTYEVLRGVRGVSLQCAKSYCKELDVEFDEIFEIWDYDY